MFAETSFILLMLCFVTSTLGTEVKHCKDGDTKKIDVTIGKCNEGRCELKRKTTLDISIKFTPEVNVEELTTVVYAIIANHHLPFIGVNGTSACDKIFSADGETKSNFPLKAGVTYIYRNSISVLRIYPKLSLDVHWALKAKDQDIVCFEKPAIIV